MSQNLTVRFSGDALTNVAKATAVVASLNALVPVITKLVNNGTDLYVAIQHAVETVNRQHQQNAQVEIQANVSSQSLPQPIVQAFWDYHSGCFRLAQWHPQYQQWFWI